jgi:hypothetical protein
MLAGSAGGDGAWAGGIRSGGVGEEREQTDRKEGGD